MPPLQGWSGFFKVVSPVEARIGLRILDGHIRRRLRALILRQKKRKRFILRWLIRKRQVSVKLAVRDVYKGHKSLWALSATTSAHKAMSSEFFDSLGLVGVQQRWHDLQPIVTAPTQLELTLG